MIVTPFAQVSPLKPLQLRLVYQMAKLKKNKNKSILAHTLAKGLKTR